MRGFMLYLLLVISVDVQSSSATYIQAYFTEHCLATAPLLLHVGAPPRRRCSVPRPVEVLDICKGVVITLPFPWHNHKIATLHPLPNWMST